MGQWERLLSEIIDVPTWDAAKWNSVAFLSFPDVAPAMGIFFEDKTAGRKIFTDWITHFGQADQKNFIRVTIVEGSIPGKEPGYSVYIGPDFDNITAKANAIGEDLTNQVATEVGRYLRVNPDPGSLNFPRFKRDYQRFRHFALMPVFGSFERPDPEFQLAVLKRRIHFRLVEELMDQDIEKVVLK
jgi:hypothetical protein